MRRVLTTVCLVLAVAVTGCGGGNGDDASPTTAATPSDLPRFCTLLKTYTERFAALTAATATPAQIRQTVDELGPTIQEAVQAAPPEARADAALVASAVADYIAALRTSNYDPSRVPPDSLQKLQSRDTVAATGRLLSYSQSNCSGG